MLITNGTIVSLVAVAERVIGTKDLLFLGTVHVGSLDGT
jgi:hypothetical protein